MANKISVKQIEGNATQHDDGLMSASDKEKLDNLENIDTITNEEIDTMFDEGEE